jgi:hypothetical protein
MGVPSEKPYFCAMYVRRKVNKSHTVNVQTVSGTGDRVKADNYSL